ncbi:MAG: hypothetical protein A3D96_05575 [Chlamydiae bacterium RIFCSPHIGHO2_12_FULL_44_59]|nr:MAG: hypothetical protein A3D96_05575 [Chlamydiae bacterium RIFCSPHIGHO2_12_FULL_44_59]OGN71358.1 MAG: hypothetical protein A3F79_03070 [Chlamydiae bacterium RIFCSPLOWO2_12_FULL_45_20]
MRYWLAFFLIVSIATSSTTCMFYNKLKQKTREIRTLSIRPVVLKKKLQKDPPRWMIDQIENDLAAYSSGITKEMLDRAFCGDKVDTFSLVRFSIQRGHISFSHDEKNLDSKHFKGLLGCIKKLQEFAPLPDVDFIVSLEDGFSGNPGIGPCFVFAKREHVTDLILIPDIKALTGYEKLRTLIPKTTRKWSWSQKVAKCFWRGATTGGYSTLTSWQELARAKLVLLSLNHPTEIDARFHNVVQCDREVPSFLKAKGMVSPSVSRPDHLKYKYLVDVDGNSCSYERFFWLLLSNSVVLKQITPNVQWYYSALKPYQHFIPIQEDLSDLLEKIQWARTHDREAEEIARHATAFVEENLSAEDILVYLYHLIKKYSNLQR